MNKTSYNNFYNYLPYLHSNRNNNNKKLDYLNPNYKSFEQISSPDNSFTNNKILFNDISNYRKIQVIKKINSLRKNRIRKDILPPSNVKNIRYFINKNNDINIINKKDKNKTFYMNKDKLSNLSLEKNNINNTSKNNLILDLNRSDSFKKINSAYLFKCLLNKIASEPRKEIKEKAFKNTVYKLSSFYKKSKDKKITARQIYEHYLQNDRIKPKNKRHQFNGSYDYSYVMCPKLKIVYGINSSFMAKLNEIKKNDNIAKKKDFDVIEYQNILMKLFEKKISGENMDKMRNQFNSFNEKNYGISLPKGRYINLALKLKDHLSHFAYENIKKMDKNYTKYFANEKENKIEAKNKSKRKKKIQRDGEENENENDEDISNNYENNKNNKNNSNNTNLTIKKIKFKKS